MPFTLVERDLRWSKVRARMDARGVDVLIALPQWQDADARYLAGRAGSAVILPLNGDPIEVVAGEDSHLRVGRAMWIDDRRSASSTGSTRTPFGEAVATVVSGMGLRGCRIGVAGLVGHAYASVRQPEGYVNHTTFRKIEDALNGSEIVDATGILAEARYVKSDEEVAVLERGVRIAEASAATMHACAATGTMQGEVFGQMLLSQMRDGADDPHVAWCPGLWGERRPRLTTTPPGALTGGTFVATEIFPTVEGYTSQIAEPMVIGEPNAEALEVFALGTAAFEVALRAMVPGRTWRDVESDVQAVADGSPWKIDFLLHGRGLGQDGPIFVPTDTRREAAADELQPGTVFVLKPNAYPRDQQVPVARSHDVNWGDTVVVHTDGARRLGTRPMKLEDHR